jgi:hypothetical protein
MDKFNSSFSKFYKFWIVVIEGMCTPIFSWLLGSLAPSRIWFKLRHCNGPLRPVIQETSEENSVLIGTRRFRTTLRLAKRKGATPTRNKFENGCVILHVVSLAIKYRYILIVGSSLYKWLDQLGHPPSKKIRTGNKTVTLAKKNVASEMKQLIHFHRHFPQVQRSVS